ncbi:MAG: hypothetical protein KGL99_03350 [Burkholderiales bacterium]|nr:hypothetical protein [Burkholderiales bacterium]MDE2626167.1 hypothetical protein [Burkholderiales bacterium]
MTTIKWLATGALTLTLAGPVAATVVVGSGAPSANAPAQAGSPAAALPASRADGTTLRSGTVTAVSVDGARIQVDGTWFKLAAGKTRVYQRGAELKAAALTQGTKIRFTIAPGGASKSAAEATLGAVYIP